MTKTPWAILILLVSCTEVVLLPEPEPEPEPETLSVRIATYNVRRFFDTVCDSGNCGGGAFEALPGQAVFLQRADELANAILDLDADVVLLQEIETQACLDALLASSDGLLVGAFGEIGTPGSVDVAVVSRSPMIGIRHHRPDLLLADGSLSIFSRELLEVQLFVRGMRVVVFAAHFRSKVNDQPLRRLAEAQVASQIAASRAIEFPDAIVVLGGDFNDTPGTPPLDAIEERGLERVAEELGAGAATFIFQGVPLALDHLMLAPNAGEYIPGTAKVIGLGGYANSDHAALLADFTVSQ